MATARELFVERGYGSVSMQQIADAAGLRKASLYHHFKSKEVLFVDVTVAEMDRVLSEVANMLPEDGTIAEYLEQLALANYEQLAHGDLFRLVRELFQHVPESEYVGVYQRLREMEDFFAGIFARAMERGEFEEVDPHYAGRMFFHMMMTLANDPHDFHLKPPPPPEEAAKLVTRVMLYGLAKR